MTSTAFEVPAELKTVYEAVLLADAIFVERRYQLVQAVDRVNEAIGNYNNGRVQLFANRLKVLGRGWCTVSRHVVSKDDLRPFLIETAGRVVHRACSKCEADYLKKADDDLAAAWKLKGDGQDGMKFLDHGVWKPLAEPFQLASEAAGQYDLTDRVCAEYGIPPAASFDPKADATLLWL